MQLFVESSRGEKPYLDVLSFDHHNDHSVRVIDNFRVKNKELGLLLYHEPYFVIALSISAILYCYRNFQILSK